MLRKLILLRFAEQTIICGILSFICSLVFMSGKVRLTVFNCTMILFAASILFIVVNSYLLWQCYVDISDTRAYLMVNLGGYAVFAVLSMIAVFILPSAEYTWVFGITKLWAIAFGYSLSNRLSAVIFHLIMLLIVAVSPVFMNLVKKGVKFHDDCGEDFDE